MQIAPISELHEISDLLKLVENEEEIDGLWHQNKHMKPSLVSLDLFYSFYSVFFTFGSGYF